ncbi:hypothetical protein BHE74_00027540 [Ensete ventricosum]|nr:hypothetical protein BHE74_00027540 [Ensete ventricosum]
MVVSVISRGKDAKRKVAPTGQISRKNVMVLQRENHVQQTAHVEEYLNTITPQSSTDRASDSSCMVLKTKRASRHMHLISEKYLTEELRRLNLRRTESDPATKWRRPCMGVAIYLSIDQGELLEEHKSVEAGGRKVQGKDDESRGAQLPKSQAFVRMELDSEECHSAAEADLPIAKKGTQI